MIKSFLHYIRKHWLLLSLVLIVAVFTLYSCANMASPQGGDYDFDPPKVVRTYPAMNATNVKPSKIEIFFDELIQLENPSEKIIVTPPQKKIPVIQAINRKVTIEIKDTLRENTTYTIDFTDAIADFNEKNILENFSFSFSTGDKIDSMAVSGKVLSAENLEPVKKIYVGLHNDLADSAFTSKPFEKISMTNESGFFTVRGLGDEKYRMFALNDILRSYIYENPETEIAFLDSIIKPGVTTALREDTIFNKKDMSVDSVMQVEYTRFIPDNIILRSFKSNFRRLYLRKHERPHSDMLKIQFSAANDLPKLEPLNFEVQNKDWFLLERTSKSDSLIYWITDKAIASKDTLNLQVVYNITDTLNNIVSKTDTLRFIDRTRKVDKKKEKDKKDKENEPQILPLKFSASGAINMYDTISLTFDEPIVDFDKNKFNLKVLVDTVYVNDENFNITQDAYNPRKYSFIYKWLPGKSYQINADSTAFHSYSGLATGKIDNKLTIRPLEEYGDLYIGLHSISDGTPAFVELLNPQDIPVRKIGVKYKNGEAGVTFRHLMPGIFYARIIIDSNNNGVWDTGDYYTNKQPEMVYYYDKSFDIKANWQKEEMWDIMALPLDKQKPLEITKNKPQEKESKRKMLEKEDKKNQNKKKQEEKERNQQNNIGGYAGRNSSAISNY